LESPGIIIMKTPHLLCALPGWLLQIAIQIPLMLLGVPLIAIAAACRAYGTVGAYFPNYLQWRWPWMWLWGNQENGISGAYGSLPDGWPKTHWPLWQQIFVWSAWRNSVGNARWTRLLGMTVNPSNVCIYRGSSEDAEWLKEGPYLAWQGWRYELKFCWNPKQPDWRKRRYCWIGWRIAQQTYVTVGVGFAFQPWAKL
jgi:hypothetical protein